MRNNKKDAAGAMALKTTNMYNTILFASSFK
jgi:hypothetical protein